MKIKQNRISHNFTSAESSIFGENNKKKTKQKKKNNYICKNMKIKQNKISYNSTFAESLMLSEKKKKRMNSLFRPCQPLKWNEFCSLLREAVPYSTTFIIIIHRLNK